MDANLSRLAHVIVEYSTRVKAGDLVGIHADPISQPLVEAIYEKVLEAGAHPFWVVQSETLKEIMLEKGSDAQLTFQSPLDLQRVQALDVAIVLWADTNTKSAGAFDPAKPAMMQAARKEFMKIFMNRAAEGDLRWCGTLYPTQASAQDAEMSFRQYERFVYGAGLLDDPDPVASWQRVHERQQRICEFLQGKKEVRFTAPACDGHDGTSLTVGVDGATWINCAGTENFPDGEVFAGPQTANGHVNYTFPAVYQSREVEGVRLEFRDGRVVDASAKKNEKFLIEMLDLDAGARTMGEIAIGTNYGIKDFSKNTLFDEKIGGTFHAAVGAGYPESGNSNESGLHWDMVCDLRPRDGVAGGKIEVDGEVLHRDGKFVVPGLEL